MNILEINEEINKLELGNKGDISDGSHTFDELYYHRMILFAFILRRNKGYSWRSKLHDDGTMFDDYFICGIETNKGQFTYHYHIDYWDKFDGVPELEKAPTYDGHTSEDVEDRLFSML